MSLHTNRYRLGKPSAEYEPLVRDFNRSVQYAIAIHLFVNDVVGVDDTDEDQVIGLDMLLELMTDHSIDRGFVQQNGCVIYDLLRDLNMNEKFPFMLELVSGPAVFECKTLITRCSASCLLIYNRNY